MSLNLSSASSQSISLASPALTMPFSIGMWVRPVSNANLQMFLSFTQSGQDHYIGLNNTGPVWSLTANAAVTGGTVTYGAWHYVLYRAISATNKRLDVLESTGVHTSIQNTTNTSMAAISALTIGVYLGFFYWNGQVAEYFRADVDIAGDGGALSTTILRQLAYRGPFSVPRIRKDIIEYRSFRSRTTLNDTAEVYWRPGTPQPRWTATNGPLGGYPQPPHSAGYVTPWGGDRLLPVYELDEIVVPSAAERTQRGGFIANVGGLLSRF